MCMRGRCLARRRLTTQSKAPSTESMFDPNLVFLSYRDPNYVVSNNSPRLNRSPLTEEEMKASPFGKYLKLRSRSVDSSIRNGGSTSQFLHPPKEDYLYGNAKLLPKWTNKVSPMSVNDKRNFQPSKNSASLKQLPEAVNNEQKNTTNGVNKSREKLENWRRVSMSANEKQQENFFSDKRRSISTSNGSINCTNLISDGNEEEDERELIIIKF
ncbi:unnamed protein product [Cylicocyclus nassatus]|uniref:Uncharacterized protein n=1 Tax=Cylicocyclus nassatus TaxID=53992 RepID=A0AA36M4S8_CYLNA|nr:unnamed protein product [Cylicocyclus nassatus]